MSFSVEYSGLAITHLIYKASLIVAVVRWIFSSALRLITCNYRSGNSVDDAEQSQMQLLQSLAAAGVRVLIRAPRPPLPPPTTLSMVSEAAAAAAAAASDDDDDDKFEGQMMMLLDHAATYEEIAGRLPESYTTCAVCLDELRKADKVRELRNCCHVFHKRCIDRWLNHNIDPHHSTCPVCRTPILRYSSSIAALTRSEPSWAVERLLYLFGDDLHPLL
ncbi:E3 ubiquitin-protein ligase RNF6-like [Macadamia integrifolia]|uniref:E3 ubiquitin-protein ligase RNF6-like n=1 Tax=Macadamia integrifolia TaxID=60698 RepID=UPI001C4FDCF2|nr:E3 ubiquitin-protein ligase RNF6-like [Macadamia integrifolia]